MELNDTETVVPFYKSLMRGQEDTEASTEWFASYPFAISCTLYRASEVGEGFTDELHLFLSLDETEAFLSRIESGEPLRGKKDALHYYWELGEDGEPVLQSETGLFDLSAAKWNGENLCVSQSQEGTLEEMSHYANITVTIKRRETQ